MVPKVLFFFASRAGCRRPWQRPLGPRHGSTRKVQIRASQSQILGTADEGHEIVEQSRALRSAAGCYVVRGCNRTQGRLTWPTASKEAIGKPRNLRRRKSRWAPPRQAKRPQRGSQPPDYPGKRNSPGGRPQRVIRDWDQPVLPAISSDGGLIVVLTRRRWCMAGNLGCARSSEPFDEDRQSIRGDCRQAHARYEIENPTPKHAFPLTAPGEGKMRILDPPFFWPSH